MTEKAAVRLASSDDAPGIAAVMGAVWHDDTPDLARISSVISLHDHAAFAAEVRGEVTGFADSFPTIAQNGRLSLATKMRLDLAGALIPSDDAAMLDAARGAGYRLVGDYQGWQARVTPGAAEAPR